MVSSGGNNADTKGFRESEKVAGGALHLASCGVKAKVYGLGCECRHAYNKHELSMKWAYSECAYRFAKSYEMFGPRRRGQS